MKTSRTILEQIGFRQLADFAISDDEIHVWNARLDQPDWLVKSFDQFLTAEEVQRSAQFRLMKHSQRFVVARGLLRAILGCYTGRTPSRLQLCYGRYGKPALVSTTNHDDNLEFSLSHSDGLAVFGFARNRRVGVDLERIRTNLEYEQIASRFFSQEESTKLMALQPQTRHRAFFACWTRKEAYLKATGEGFSHPLDGIVVTLAPDEPVEIVKVRGDPKMAARWSLRELMPEPGYIAALAAEGHGWILKQWSDTQRNPLPGAVDFGDPSA